MNESTDAIWLIHKAGRGFYRPQRAGYTERPERAGRYSLSEAQAAARDEPEKFQIVRAPEMLPEPIVQLTILAAALRGIARKSRGATKERALAALSECGINA
jgi:hypothetical protein